MPVLDQPSTSDIDETVQLILRDAEGPIEFSELEQRAAEKLQKLANRLQVRQSAWRLVRARRAAVTKDLKVKST